MVFSVCVCACVCVFVLIAVLLSLLYVAAFLYTGQRFWTECHTQCRSACFSHSLRHLAVAGESVVAGRGYNVVWLARASRASVEWCMLK